MTINLPSVEHNPNARFVKRDFCQNPPGECYLCNRGNVEGGFADPGVYIEWVGQLYFCFNCIAEMGRLFGLVTPDVYNSYLAYIKKQDAQLAELRSSVDSLEKQVDAFSAQRLRDRGMLDGTSNLASELNDVRQEHEDTSVEPSAADRLAAATDELLAGISEPEGSDVNEGSSEDGHATEPAVSEGPDDVRESASEQSDSLTKLGF